MNRFKIIPQLMLGMALVAMLTLFPNGADAARCSDCHPAMLEKPFYLQGDPPLDIMSAFYSPCFDYNRVLEEWFYTESLFNTIEMHFEDLVRARVDIEDFEHNLQTYRDLYRQFKSLPVESADGFKRRAGGFRYQMGKTYSEVRAAGLELNGRTVFGVMMLATIFLIILFVAGWRIASGPAEVHPDRSNEEISSDDIKEEEAVK